ncbi:nuclear transport factor 2 family protein [Streptomyces sp. NEAU-W12]|uniref:nuclear transport factor 2 family protein n=1 Tax=Streptomyces sp. NEAU-W12 TaxID=2994668 RepID=UPI00224AAD54|nr:nuclear transport factor 2 family protein [Streptomyces sp. NEAU-W12]MCX2928038.1 nuclear transport factor 2 family protein [Streptomyces sp. NEAU-W12]MCX2928248.1 nuclear transport factor 2 family protein [Streptomyces sp. NEAU-W12]
MTTHQHDEQTATGCAVVEALHSSLAQGDVPALLAGLDERIEWVVPPGLHYGGTYRGREQIPENVFSRFATEWQDFTVAPAGTMQAGDRGIVLGHCRSGHPRRRQAQRPESGPFRAWTR